MPEEKDEAEGFKVVDRRVFSTDGTRREEAPEETKARETAPGPSLASAGEAREPEAFFPEGPQGFESLVQHLAMTAMFQLGLVATPQGERIPTDLPNARRTIDMLEVLQQKTRGNLTPSESGFLEEVLYDLRMSFVEINKRQGRQPK